MPSELQKKLRQGRFFSWGGAMLLIGIVIVLNFIMGYVPLRLDLSDGRIYSISAGTKQILNQLDDTLLVKIGFSSNLPSVYKANQQYVADLLSEYKRASNGKVRVEYFDPGKSPAAREEATRQGLIPMQVDVRERDRREVKEVFMGLTFYYGDKTETLPAIQNVRSLEYEISSRIKKLVNPQKMKIGILSNGGAQTMDVPSLQAVGAYIAQIHQVETLDAAKPIPADIRSLWLFGPEKSLEKEAVENIRTFVKNGGTLGVFADLNNIMITSFLARPNSVDLSPILQDWGIEIRRGLVWDPRSDRIQVQAVQGAFRMINIVEYPYFPLITDLNRQHPATKDLDAVSFPFVSPVSVAVEKDGYNYITLAQTSPLSLLDPEAMDVNPLKNKQFDEKTERGPFATAMIVEAPADPQAGGKPGRLIVFGTSRFIQSDFPSRDSNYALFVNLVDWSVQDEALLQIRTKGYSQKPLRPLSDSLRLFYKYLLVAGLPLMALAAGIVAWQWTQKRRLRLKLQYQEA